MTNIVRMTRHHETHVTRTLTSILELARSGKVHGVMYVLAKKHGSHAGMCGTFRDYPDSAVEAAHDAMKSLYTYTVRKHIDPMTATDLMI